MRPNMSAHETDFFVPRDGFRRPAGGFCHRPASNDAKFIKYFQTGN
ncbi:hypothetical protein [uncultured Bacteroides sp.]|nr:hypothetical protein [uncultured Bacteroides sp.]